jgi:hypothetical protein
MSEPMTTDEYRKLGQLIYEASGLRADNAALRKRIAELEAALRPFSRLASPWMRDESVLAVVWSGDVEGVGYRPTVRDLRRAAELLKGVLPGGDQR